MSQAALAGLVLGCVVLVRWESMIVFPLVLFWVVAVAARRGAWRAGISSAALFALCAVLTVSPVTCRNYRASGEFTPVAYTGEYGFYVGNNPYADGYSPHNQEILELIGKKTVSVFDLETMADSLGQKLGYGRRLTYPEWKAYFNGGARKYILGHPVETLRMMARRALWSLGPEELDENKVIRYEKEHSRTLRHLPGFPWPLSLFILGLVFLALDAWRRRAGRGIAWESTVLLLLFTGAYFALFLPVIAGGGIACR
jgi:hypothetical protein